MRRFYSPPESFEGPVVTLGEDETRHLRDVLRLQSGSGVRVFDGLGREFLCLVESVGKKSSLLKITGEVPPASPESGLDLTLAAAVLKGEKFDLVVQKAVELGVTTFVPLQTKRGDVKIKDAEKKLERWRKIALEAAKQSGRAKLMEIPGTFDLQTLLEGSEAADNFVMFSEREGAGLSSLNPNQKITALVGPEGGWDDAEIEVAGNKGCSIVTLGGRTLRAETAAISIAAILQHRFGDMS